MSQSNPRPAIEALLFASDQPLTLPLLADALDMDKEALQAELAALAGEYRDRGAGVELREIAGGWVFVTAPEHGEVVARMLRGKRKMRLSRAALETLAIIAYKQPVTKSEVEAIRGVDASGVLATLLERSLVTVRGRSQVVGRPLLYGTTAEFLNYFGLSDLTELPRPEELRALVAAREPEQLEMLELDPADGLPLPAADGEPAAAPPAGGDARASTAETAPDDDLAAADAALAEAGGSFGEPAFDVADDRAVASDADDASGGGDDDDEFDEDEDEDEWDDDDEDDEDDEDDGDEDDDETSDRPGLALSDRDGGR
jgi:segregation and condensation protein B